MMATGDDLLIVFFVVGTVRNEPDFAIRDCDLLVVWCLYSNETPQVLGCWDPGGSTWCSGIFGKDEPGILKVYCIASPEKMPL